MKIEKVIERIRSELSPAESKVYSFISNTHDEVFTNRELAQRLQMVETTVKTYTRRLSRDRRIFLHKVGNLRFYGSENAIRELEKGLKGRVKL